jgi:glycosyltransferase involved in cell wall biosynthesis
MKPKKILILWSQPTSYFLSSVRELVNLTDADCTITVVVTPEDEWYPEITPAYSLGSINFLRYKDFKPRNFQDFDLIVMTSWNFRKYRSAARKIRDSLRIMTMDNQYLKTKKQELFLASKVGPLYIRYLVDVVFVGGSRQSAYATRIGFHTDQILSGAFSYDNRIFHAQKSSSQMDQFCFVGRKVAVKGLDVLLSAYESYRTLCVEKRIRPWDLVIAGPGRFNRELPAGVRELNYLSPSEVAALCSSSKCFVLPSLFEPFGVVLLEAAASGCLLIASSAVGAADALITENINGYVYPKDSSSELSESLLRISLLSDQQSDLGRKESISRVEQFSPEVWATKILEAYSTQMITRLSTKQIK